MTPEQQRKILEAAAKACGIKCEVECFPNGRCIGTNQYNEIVFDPRGNPADCAEMCAKLEINQFHWPDAVACDTQRPSKIGAETSLKDHDNSRLKAWMFAATMVAAKIGGFES